MLSNRTLPEGGGRKRNAWWVKKSHRSGITHQVVQHPHEGLKLGFAHFPLELAVEGKSSYGGLWGLELLAVQEREVAHAAWTPQSIDLSLKKINKIRGKHGNKVLLYCSHWKLCYARGNRIPPKMGKISWFKLQLNPIKTKQIIHTRIVKQTF